MIEITLPKKINIESQKDHLDLIENNKKFKKFLKDVGLIHYYAASQKKLTLEDRRVSNYPHIPDLSDLYYIYYLIVLNNRINVLEYGTGWSSLIIYKALLAVKKKKKNNHYTRCGNPYGLTIIDNSKKFIKISKNRIDKEFGKKTNISFNYSKCEMTTYIGRYAHHYTNHPVVNPDFIFLDGPNNFYVTGKVEKFTVNNFSMQPMGCDILKFENYLLPGTIILADGRSANMRFLQTNFIRRWRMLRLYDSDLNILILDEEPLGLWNKEQLDFYDK